MTQMPGSEKVILNFTIQLSLAPDDERHIRPFESLPAPVNHVCCTCKDEFREQVETLQEKIV